MLPYLLGDLLNAVRQEDSGAGMEALLGPPPVKLSLVGFLLAVVHGLITVGLGVYQALGAWDLRDLGAQVSPMFFLLNAGLTLVVSGAVLAGFKNRCLSMVTGPTLKKEVEKKAKLAIFRVEEEFDVATPTKAEEDAFIMIEVRKYQALLATFRRLKAKLGPVLLAHFCLMTVIWVVMTYCLFLTGYGCFGREGWKLMSFSHSQELCQPARWLLIGCKGVNNQSEARSAS